MDCRDRRRLRPPLSTRRAKHSPLTAQAPEKAILVGLDLKRRSRRQASPAREPDASPRESLEELVTLAESAGAVIVDSFIQNREQADAATLIGSGKVEELAAQIKAQEIETVIFDYELSPTQLRNLEGALDTKILDRTQLILDIFARRARTREGQLQVELAQLNYLMPRLTGKGVALSRLGGGIGTRGPGETKLETDRRLIARRIQKLQRELESVRSGRSVQRRQRQAVPLATLGLAGYTNAGKSTLFNRITGAEVLADARMFATLDPTVRQFRLPSNRKALISDTVGFIRNLPTTLVKAFRATLEEVTEATVLLHVLDAASPHAAENMRHVERVLAEIGAETSPRILVLNKIDLLPDGDRSDAAALARLLAPEFEGATVGVSARSGLGIDRLLEIVDRVLPLDPVAPVRFRFPAADGWQLNFLHEYAKVLSTSFGDPWVEVEAEAPESVRQRLAEWVVE